MILKTSLDFFREYIELKDATSLNPFSTDAGFFDKIRRFNKAFFSKHVRYQNFPAIEPSELEEYLLRKSSDISYLSTLFIPSTLDINLIEFEFVSRSENTSLLRAEQRKNIFNLNDLLDDQISKKYFVSTPYNIKSELKTWDRLASITNPCDYVVINDMYIFKDRKKLKVVFDMISALHQKIRNTEKLIVINTALESFNALKIDTPLAQELLKKQIISKHAELQVQFPDIKFVLSVNKYHMRMFFTNMQFFTSSNSFTSYFYVNEMLSCYPHLAFDETQNQIYIRSNYSYMTETLNLVISSEYYHGDKTAVNSLLKDLSIYK